MRGFDLTLLPLTGSTEKQEFADLTPVLQYEYCNHYYIGSPELHHDAIE